MLLILGRRAGAALRLVQLVESRHPRTAHYYLGGLGTDPPWQGKGLGSAVLRPVLESCDREGMPAYLESSKESNIPFYRRHGFEVTDEVSVPDGPVRLWLMWREPLGPPRWGCRIGGAGLAAARRRSAGGRRVGVAAHRSGGTGVNPSGILAGSKTTSVSRSSTARAGAEGKPVAR